MLKLDIAKSAADFISARVPKHQRQIVARIQDLRSDPEPADSKPLKGGKRQFRRADIGEYRILYQVEGDMLYVLAVGKRNDDEVYRRFGKR